MVGFTDALVKAGGTDLVRVIGRSAVVNSTSKMLRPFISVLTAMGGTSPRAYFSRWAQTTSTSLRNVAFEWLSGSPGQGTLTISYPAPVPQAFASYWYGAFDVVFEQSSRVGESRLEAYREGRIFAFALSWKKR